jgi:hypothetical protein
MSNRIEHSVAIAAYAKAKGIDTATAGKLFRSRLRTSFAKIAKSDGTNYGSKGKVKRQANDKRPWGTHSRAVLADLFPEVSAFKRAPREAKVTEPAPVEA